MSSPVFDFDGFELDAGGYELRRGGRTVRLQRVPMDLLIFLLERRGVLVTRDEIAARVWNGDGLVDTQSSINTAVRKIRQALGDNGEQPRFVETVVGKGYRFVGEVKQRVPAQESATEAPVEARPALAPAKRQTGRRTLIAGAAMLVIGAMAVVFLHRAVAKREPMTIVPFAALPGLQSWPAFSPDGNQVAFGWTGEAGNCSHIYVKTVGVKTVGVKTVGRGSPVKMTDSDGCDSSPSWSRDGRWIAFLRRFPVGGLGVCVMRATGGAAHKIAMLNGPSEYRPAWTPDGKSLVVMDSDPADAPPGLFRVAVDSGEKRRITTAQFSGTGDWCPAYSPNGRILAYLHDTGSRRLAPLYVVPVDAEGMPAKVPRMIDAASAGFIDFDWSADGRSLIASTPSGLVRVPASGGSVEPLPFPDGSKVTVAPRGNQIVYVQRFRDTDIFRVPGARGAGAVTRLISSTRQESAPQYSNDAQRIVFVSDRTGSEEIWAADREGGNEQQITSFGGPAVGSPQWSPDGKWIVFDSTAAGRPAIFVIAANGGPARRITPLEAASVRPSWSHDGRWIYFGSDRSGEWQVWKTTPEGGPLIQLTQKGGREAFEDSNAEFVYYTRRPPEKGIWRVASSGGEEIKISDTGKQGRWALGGSGIYCQNGPDELVFKDFSGKRCVRVPTLGLRIGQGHGNVIGAAPDDSWVLLTVEVRSEARMALVRNFQ